MSLPHSQQDKTSAKNLIGLLRHGITQWNEEKRIQGSMDSPLSEHGRKMTRAWARQLVSENWDRIVASDLERVRETVAILNAFLQLPLYFETKLREIHWGQWEGLPIKDIYNQGAAMVEEMEQAGWEFRPPQGESRKEALTRAKVGINEAARRWPGEKILVVCHLGIIKCLICDSVASSFLPGETPSISKDSMHLLEVEDGRISSLKLNIPLMVSV